MLHYHKGPFFDEMRGEYHPGYLVKSRMIIGGVGKYYIVAAATAFDKSEYVAFYDTHVVGGEFLLDRAYESHLSLCQLYSGDFGGLARKEFKCHCACTGEKVAYAFPFYILEILDYVEYILAGEVGRRAGGYVFGRVETPAPVFSSDYSHMVSFLYTSSAALSGSPLRRAPSGSCIGMASRQNPAVSESTPSTVAASMPLTLTFTPVRSVE